jgi:ribosome-binding factor A
MTSEERTRRISNRILEEVAVILQQEVSDPRLQTVTVTGVEVDRALAFATIYISALDAKDRIKEIMDALNGARGFLRSQLAARIPLRSFPQLRFRQDSSLDRGARIDELLTELKQEGDPAEEKDS